MKGFLWREHRDFHQSSFRNRKSLLVRSMGDSVSSQFNTCLEVLKAIRLFSKGCSGSMVEENVITKELKAESSKWLWGSWSREPVQGMSSSPFLV